MHKAGYVGAQLYPLSARFSTLRTPITVQDTVLELISNCIVVKYFGTQANITFVLSVRYNQ